MQPMDYRMRGGNPVTQILKQRALKMAQDNQTRQLDMSETQNAANNDYRQNVLDQRIKEHGQNYGLAERRVNMGETAQERQLQQYEEAKAEKIRLATEKRDALAEFNAKPNKGAEDYAAMITAHPEISSDIKAGWDLLNDDAKRQHQTEAVQIYSAINAGQKDVAKGIINTRLRAAQAKGDEKTVAGSKAMLSIIDQNPEAAKTSMGLYLASVSDGSNLAYTLGALDKINPGNTAQDTKSLGAAGRAMGLKQNQINKALVNTRGKSYDERMAALQNAAGGKKEAKRKTTVTEMKSLMEYGDDAGLTASQVQRVASQTKGAPIEDRFAALDALSRGEEVTPVSEGASEKKTDAAAFDWSAYEGQRVKGPDGTVSKVVNGKLQKVE